MLQNFFQNLQELQEILGQENIASQELANVTSRIIEVLPEVDKTIKHATKIIGAFQGWKRESQNLANVLDIDMSICDFAKISLDTHENKSISDEQDSQRSIVKNKRGIELDAETELSEKPAETVAIDLPQQMPSGKKECEENHVLQNEKSVDTIQLSLPEHDSAFPTSFDRSQKSKQEIPQQNQSAKDSFGITEMDEYLSEVKAMQELQIDREELEEFVNQNKLYPTMIEGQRCFSKKKVILLRSMAMASSTAVIEKPVKQPIIFLSKSKKKDTDHLIRENEVLNELQISVVELNELISEGKLLPTCMDNDRYFSRKEVRILRSKAMNLSTIKIEKPKKKKHISFWKEE